VFRCKCGAEQDAIEVTELGGLLSYVPGEHLEPCTCPKCPFCARLVDGDGRCENLDCTYVGLHVNEGANDGATA